jgi:hypothetical protein
MSRIFLQSGHSPQRPDWLAEDAVRRETVSRAALPAFLRFAGRFSEIAGRADPVAIKFHIGFSNLAGILPDLRSREHFLALQGGAGSFLVLQGRAALNCEWLQGLARGLRTLRSNTAGPRTRRHVGSICHYIESSSEPRPPPGLFFRIMSTGSIEGRPGAKLALERGTI